MENERNDLSCFSVFHIIIKVYRRVRQGELWQSRKRRCPGVRPRRTVSNDWYTFSRRGAHCAPTQRQIKRLVGEQCSPLRDTLCKSDTSGAPRSAHPTAQRVQFAVAVQNIRASELRGTVIPQGTLSCPSGNSPCAAPAEMKPNV